MPINGVKFWLWHAIDANGDVLNILVQKQRNAKAAKRFLKRLIGRFGTDVRIGRQLSNQQKVKFVSCPRLIQCQPLRLARRLE